MDIRRFLKKEDNALNLTIKLLTIQNDLLISPTYHGTILVKYLKIIVRYKSENNFVRL